MKQVTKVMITIIIIMIWANHWWLMEAMELFLDTTNVHFEYYELLLGLEVIVEIIGVFNLRSCFFIDEEKTNETSMPFYWVLQMIFFIILLKINIYSYRIAQDDMKAIILVIAKILLEIALILYIRGSILIISKERKNKKQCVDDKLVNNENEQEVNYKINNLEEQNKRIGRCKKNNSFFRCVTDVLVTLMAIGCIHSIINNQFINYFK